MKILVTGGRGYKDRERVFCALYAADEKNRITLIIEGGATGVDRFARAWALVNQVAYITEEADWGKLGKAAGPLRNKKMLVHTPDGVIAFPGGKGTEDMCRQAERAGLKIWRPYGK